MTTLYSFKDFMENLVLEALHPELQDIAKAPTTAKNKKVQLVKKIKELSDRGEKTGIEGNMPKGSSRAYMAHEEPHNTTVDGKPASFKVGTKVAIKSALDSHHKKERHGGQSLGQIQNRVENDDDHTNDNFRILTKTKDGYSTNHNRGIFPPIVEHHEGHEYSTVGHARNIKAGEFRKLTRTESHPKGISHDDFYSALHRDHESNNGRYWDQGKAREQHLDHVAKHPLVQKFLDHQRTTGTPPHDYQQRGNMGVFEHPDGSQHIVARDHGFNDETSQAYRNARAIRYRAKNSR